jgi:small-conductance mechanosensitive channel
MLVTVLDSDARMEMIGSTELARIHLTRIQQAIREYRAARSPEALARAAGRVLAATLVFALAAFAVFRLRRRLDRFLVERRGTRIRHLEIQSFEVMRAEQIWAAARRALAALRTLALVALALFYVSYVLSQIPQTHSLVTNIVGFALAPVVRIGAAIVASIPNLVLLVVLFFVFRLVLGVLQVFFSAIEQGRVTLENFKQEWAQPTYKIVRTLVIAFGIIVAYPYMPGSGSAAFQGVSLFLGVMVSLGASSAIANIVAGYMLIYRRAYTIGDRVKIGDNVGEVIEMRTQVTHLRSVKNEEVIIPNSQILSAEVINYSSMSKTQGLILHTEVGIGYETPWRQVEAMLVAAAERTTELGPDTRPFVQEKKLGDFAVVYELNVYCMNVTSLPALYAALHRNILDVFNEYGIQIMTPAYEGDPEVPKVVPKQDWYTAPAVSRDER